MIDFDEMAIKPLIVADKERFELSVPVKVRTLSRGVVSATHPLVLLWLKV